MLGFESLRARLGHRSPPALGRVFVVPVGAMLGDTAACSGANSARLNGRRNGTAVHFHRVPVYVLGDRDAGGTCQARGYAFVELAALDGLSAGIAHQG